MIPSLFAKIDSLFIDANVMFSAAYRPNSGINQLWHLTNTKLITSLYAIEEAHRNLKENWQIEHLEKLTASMQTINSTIADEEVIPHNINLRSKDQPILAAAIISKAHYLITGDFRDFGCYYGKSIAGVVILPPAEYLKNKK